MIVLLRFEIESIRIEELKTESQVTGSKGFLIRGCLCGFVVFLGPLINVSCSICLIQRGFVRIDKFNVIRPHVTGFD